MGKLIDAERFKKDLHENYAFSGFTDLLNDFCAALDSQPPVDAVPVVRCKDCHQYKPGWCYLHEINMQEHDFCSRGKSW